MKKFYTPKGHYTRRHGATHLQVGLGSVDELIERLGQLSADERNNALGLMKNMRHPQVKAVAKAFA